MAGQVSETVDEDDNNPCKAISPFEVDEEINDDGETGEEVNFDDDDNDETCEECRPAIMLKCPRLPTQREVDEHNMTHLPFRDWCEYCVKAKARNVGHYRQKKKEHLIPHVHIDYAFFGVAEEGEKMIVQVARDEDNRGIFVHAVPRKGLAHEHGALQLCADLEKVGYKKIILKGDNEPAIVAVQEEIKKRREEETILENAPVGQSQSNGVAERAVQAAGEQIRVLKLALENRLGVKITATHPIMAWLATHAGDLLNKFVVGSDGKTSYELIKGKKFNKALVEFGEKVMYRRGKLNKHKLEARWEEGIFLGFDWRTGGVKIGYEGNITVAHGIRRVPIEKRWNQEEVMKIKGTPWKEKEEEEEEVSVPAEVRFLTEEEKIHGPEVQEEDEPRVTNIKLPKQLFLDNGFTSGCPGCRALLKGGVMRVHTSECRARMEKILGRTKEGQNKRDRHNETMNEHIAKKIAKGIIEEETNKRSREEEDHTEAKKQNTHVSFEEEGSTSSRRQREDEDADEDDERKKRAKRLQEALEGAYRADKEAMKMTEEEKDHSADIKRKASESEEAEPEEARRVQPLHEG